MTIPYFVYFHLQITSPRGSVLLLSSVILLDNALKQVFFFLHFYQQQINTINTLDVGKSTMNHQYAKIFLKAELHKKKLLGSIPVDKEFYFKHC